MNIEELKRANDTLALAISDSKDLYNSKFLDGFGYNNVAFSISKGCRDVIFTTKEMIKFEIDMHGDIMLRVNGLEKFTKLTYNELARKPRTSTWELKFKQCDEEQEYDFHKKLNSLLIDVNKAYLHLLREKESKEREMVANVLKYFVNI